MKYKLKEHVTDEMLVECGFDIKQFGREKTAWKGLDDGEDSDNMLYIVLDENSDEPKNTINTLYTIDLTPYIQDLIDLNYVEVVE